MCTLITLFVVAIIMCQNMCNRDYSLSETNQSLMTIVRIIISTFLYYLRICYYISNSARIYSFKRCTISHSRLTLLMCFPPTLFVKLRSLIRLHDELQLGDNRIQSDSNQAQTEKWDRRYFTAVATGGHSRLISRPAALLRWKQLKRGNDLYISLLLLLSLSFHMYLQPLLKSPLYSDVFIINYTIWDHYSHRHTHMHTHTQLCSSPQLKTSLSVEPASHILHRLTGLASSEVFKHSPSIQ